MGKKERQQDLLRAIVQEYITTAKPVSSKQLVQSGEFDCSPATLCSDMAELEVAGYIAQPHTSAGRVPTEKGYQYYIRHFIDPQQLKRAKKEAIERAVQLPQPDRRQLLRVLAKTLSDLTGETVVISLSGKNYFFTGIGHMFRKPEFAADAQLLLEIGDLFDHIDEVMQQVNQRVSRNVEVLIGQENPFSESLSMVVSEYHWSGEQPGVMGILGPMRMDYNTNIAMLEYVETLMDDLYDEYRER